MKSHVLIFCFSDTRTRSYILISAGSLKTFETGVTKVANKIEALKATPEE